MVIPYRTTKFKSANILAIAILGSTAKFNFHQYKKLHYTHSIIILFYLVDLIGFVLALVDVKELSVRSEGSRLGETS